MTRDSQITTKVSFDICQISSISSICLKELSKNLKFTLNFKCSKQMFSEVREILTLS